jgi:hypothetical protein
MASQRLARQGVCDENVKSNFDDGFALLIMK